TPKSSEASWRRVSIRNHFERAFRWLSQRSNSIVLDQNGLDARNRAGWWHDCQTAPAMRCFSVPAVRRGRRADAIHGLPVGSADRDTTEDTRDARGEGRFSATSARLLAELLMRAAEIGCGGILAGLDDAAADGAGAREMVEQRLAVAAADRAGQL